ncbi:nuclease [Cytobacillus sp. NCCP-133]|nr:nuclease [Cytobacillus sp. NCCP-133]
MDFPLDLIHKKKYFILHDLRLPSGPHYLQIDTLLLSEKFILILEVKNISGILYFDTIYKQLFRVKDGEETVFPCPLMQIERHEMLFKEWVLNNGFPTVPVYSMVIISNPHTGIKTIPSNIRLNNKIVHKNNLPSKIDSIEEYLNQNSLPEKFLKKMIRMLKKQNSEADPDILKRFQIEEREILRGIHCPDCNYLPLKRLKRTWHCPECRKNSHNAHIQALSDFYLLIGDSITNKRFREFLLLASPITATRLIKSLNFPHSGANKSRKYTIVFQDSDK